MYCGDGCRSPSSRPSGSHRRPRASVRRSSSPYCLRATGGVRRGRNADPRSAHNAPEHTVAGRLFRRRSPHIRADCGRRTLHQRRLKAAAGARRRFPGVWRRQTGEELKGPYCQLGAGGTAEQVPNPQIPKRRKCVSLLYNPPTRVKDPTCLSLCEL